MSTDLIALLQIFSGGLVGALVTLLASGAIYLIWRPRLRVFFSEATRGCAVDTPAWGKDQSGNVINGQQRVLRVFVENRGWTTAHNVNVSATELTFFPVSGSPSMLVDEVLEFHLALSDRSMFDLAPGAHRWVDIAYADDFGRPVELRFGFAAAPPARLSLLGFGGTGRYSFALLATADNAGAETRRIDWHWDGSRAGLRIPGP